MTFYLLMWLYAFNIVSKDREMSSKSFNATTKLEDKLSGIYEIIYKKETQIAGTIKRYSGSKSSDAQHALFLHLAINFSAIAGLFYFLY